MQWVRNRWFRNEKTIFRRKFYDEKFSTSVKKWAFSYSLKQIKSQSKKCSLRTTKETKVTTWNLKSGPRSRLFTLTVIVNLVIAISRQDKLPDPCIEIRSSTSSDLWIFDISKSWFSTLAGISRSNTCVENPLSVSFLSKSDHIKRPSWMKWKHRKKISQFLKLQTHFSCFCYAEQQNSI